MGQQIVDDELGVLRLVTDMDGQHRAVGERHHAVQLQRDGDPLILADAAVVVGLEIGHLRLLIERPGLQIQAGRIRVGGGNVGALGQRLRADDRQHDALAPVIAVYLIAGFQRHTGLEFHKALFFGQFNAVLHAHALRLAVVQKILIRLAVVVHGGLLAFRQTIVAVFRRIQQLLAQLAFFTHGMLPPLLLIVCVRTMPGSPDCSADWWPPDSC